MIVNKTQRLSIDANSLEGHSSYEKSRIMLMGAHIESLFFLEGFELFNIPDCNFVQIILVSESVFDGKELPIIDQNEKKIIIFTHLNREFYSNKIDPDSKLVMLAGIVYDGLSRLCFDRKLDLSHLKKIYAGLMQRNLFVPYSDKYYNSNLKTDIIFKTKWSFDVIFYNIEVHRNGNLIKDLHVLKTSPIYIPDEVPRELREKYVRFPEVIGWVEDNTFRITCGHKEYDFIQEEMRIHVTERENLKSNFINWQSVY